MDRTVIYNEFTEQRLSKIFKDGYSVNGVKPNLPDPYVELVVVDDEPPVFDPETQYLQKREYRSGTEWHFGWLIIDKTPTELEDEIDRKREAFVLSRRKFILGIKFFQRGGSSLESQIIGFITSLKEPNRTIAKVTMEEELEFPRKSDLVESIRKALSMTESEMDDFYRYAIREEWKP